MCAEPSKEAQRRAFLRELCPDLNEEQIIKAEERLARYLLHALEIYEEKYRSDPTVSTDPDSA